MYSQQAILSRLESVRVQPDGSAIADCPICALEGKGVGKLKIFIDGTIICYRFKGVSSDEHRKHIQEIFVAIGIEVPALSFISDNLLNGKLTIELSSAGRGRVRAVARNCDSILARDEFNVNRQAERAKFVESLDSLTPDERQTVAAALVQLSDRYDRARAAIDEEEANTNVERVISQALPDGRLIEQMAGGVFALYDPQTGEVLYADKVDCGGVTYCPLDDDFVLRGGLQLPERLIEYHDDRTLDAEIETCIRRYCDAPERELRLAAKYARFTYIADKTNELSYLRATGAPGSGKSRFIGTIGMLCLRPILVTNPSAATLYRMQDAYRPTLIVDEANFEKGSEDSTALMQILNCGFQRLTWVPRMDRRGDGQMTLRMFSAYGPKLIGSLKLSDSPAFESRCVSIVLQKTARKDIPLRMTERMLREFAELRAKLMLWRLRNWHRDYEQQFDAAEAELKGYNIEPRFIQIAIPLYGMLSDDADLKADFVRMLEGRSEDAASERRESFDGQLMMIIHKLLFEGDADGRVIRFRSDNNVPPPAEEGELCELVNIDAIADEANAGLTENKKHDPRWLGKQVRKLGLHTREIKRRASPYYRKSAIVFERQEFSRLFKLYGLPTPDDFHPPNPPGELKTNEDNSLGWADGNQNESSSESSSAHFKRDEINNLDWVGGLGGSNNVGEETIILSAPLEAEGAIAKNGAPVLVALDTETEPFDRRYGITYRNARMIGLALCYDGVSADYHTDAASWPLMLPEPELTVIFHNAKVDLDVLERAGLPLPSRWEDTMIAAHLLDENGEHGLKQLAREHLGIESPLTFNEADRMRLLDPQVFEEYARNDSRYTYRLWQQFEPRLEAEGLRPLYEMEKALVPAVRAMERRGMRIDLSLIGTLQEEVKAECQHIREEVFDYAGCKFDLNSPAKVAAILYDKLGVPCHKQTSGGKQSVDKETLMDVRGYHPAVDAILRYREIDKLAGTFINVLPNFADADGRIHPEFKALGAKTGRFSCCDPNVQQMPARSALGKRLRQTFIADADNKLVVADYSQMELRVLAHYSRDPLLVEAYTSEVETDLHTLTASRMFNRPVADVSKSERSVAKMINFGIAYGITPLGLFNRLRPEGHHVSLEDCERFIRDYFKAYRGVAEFLRKAGETIRRRGFVRNLYGRRRRLAGRTAREVRQAQNFIIQATAADIAKQAMIRLQGVLPRGAHLIAQVHDEFIVECHEAGAEEVRRLMIATMIEMPEGSTIPLKVDAHVVNNWGEAK